MMYFCDECQILHDNDYRLANPSGTACEESTLDIEKLEEESTVQGEAQAKFDRAMASPENIFKSLNDQIDTLLNPGV